MNGFRDSRKLKNVDFIKIRTRFFNKFEEFKLKSIEELDKIDKETKLSSIDRNALFAAKGHLQTELKKLEKSGNDAIEEE